MTTTDDSGEDAAEVGPYSFPSLLVDEDVAARASHLLARRLHDRYCGCPGYCTERREGTWHDDAARFTASLLADFDDAYSGQFGGDVPQT